jgi:hypothetical protein
MQKTTIFILELLLSIAIVMTGCISLLQHDFYKLEAKNWQVQAMVQDLINILVIVPCLLFTAWFSLKGKSWARAVKPGIFLYLAYTFAIYGFDIHFNQLFLFYCLILGLSYYLLVYYIFSHWHLVWQSSRKALASKTTAIYFLIIATLFYALWLSEIIPALSKGYLPQSLAETGLFTNGIQVIDLALLLPGVFIVGFLLLKQSHLGILFAPVILMFFILMNITIAVIAVVLYLKKIESDLSVMVIMGLLDVFSFALLVWFLSENRLQQDHTARETKN